MANSASDSDPKQIGPETKSQGKHPIKSASSKKITVAQIQQRYTLILGICLFSVIASIVIFIWDFYARTHIHQPNFYTFPPVADAEEPPWQGVTFPIDPRKLQSMIALDHSNFPTNVLLQWATNAATASLTFNFYNYQQILNQSRTYFTQSGYDNFLKALNTAGITAAVAKKQLAVYAVVTDTPIVLKEGEITGGGYAWQIQFPMLLTYESEKTNKLHVVITLLIARVPPSESVQGLGIASFVMQEKKLSS